eukprot:CAMPEP_0185165510 /NCGR_PEP_ID=MMETSP1139-20130426/11003_1 /TAXON_ID=298111 /ORGANISM="Pavlova sp., Strain CCMP459" /LENGTH=129 /DNA_ID=CAMNT_0027730915 /DNA_START=255 /DNA_END=644 /DNA_ORIENTATION=+
MESTYILMARWKRGMSYVWRYTRPGPVTVVLAKPSPAQHIVNMSPVLRTPISAVRSHARSTSVSMSSVSPALRSLTMIVPMAPRKATSVPSTVCRTQPCPPQQAREHVQSYSKLTLVSERPARNEPLFV